MFAQQEEYIKDETKNLKRELLRAQEEVKRIQSVPLVIGQFLEMIDLHHGIVSSTTGSNYYVRILSTLNRELLKPSSSVALHRHSNSVVETLPPEADSSIQVRLFGTSLLHALIHMRKSRLRLHGSFLPCIFPRFVWFFPFACHRHLAVC
jgi:ATP-dependent 26S proteasome regulatory subunit